MNQRENGFVSLLTTIIISLLLLVITTSLVSLETLQLRKAENSEQTMRAYYAAEAGVEDAVAKVLGGSITADQPCVEGAEYDSVGEVQWTCQQISFSGNPTGRLDNPDEARTIDPGPVGGGFSNILLEWDTGNDPVKSYDFPGGNLPSAADYMNAYAVAPIEITTVRYPTGQIPSSAISAQVSLANSLITPGGGGGSVNPMTQAGPNRSDCDRNRTTAGAPGYNGPTKYNCYVLLTGFDGSANNYLLRIRSRFIGTAYKMTFLRADGSVAPVSDGTATIDVTAKAGNTYRRVVTKLPLTNGASSKLNYVIYSDGNICKNFDVIADVPQTPPGC